MAKLLFITGTDTDVGKTFVSVALLKKLAALGKTTCALKPVSAGCDETADGQRNSDALALQEAATVKLPYAQVNPIALKDACAPHIAAANENRRIQLARLEGFCRGALMQKADFCLIEGAGGWRVPLNERENLGQLAQNLKAEAILVVGMRLGCLNHALLTVEAILRDGVKLAGWVGNILDSNMPFLDENIATLRYAIPAPCLGVMPFFPSEALVGKDPSDFLDLNILDFD